MSPVEARAADALLDRRLKLNLPAPWLLRIFGCKTIPLWVKLPTAGSLIRMSSLFARMEIDLQHLHDGNFGSVLNRLPSTASPPRGSLPTACSVVHGRHAY